MDVLATALCNKCIIGDLQLSVSMALLYTLNARHACARCCECMEQSCLNSVAGLHICPVVLHTQIMATAIAAFHQRMRSMLALYCQAELEVSDKLACCPGCASDSSRPELAASPAPQEPASIRRSAAHCSARAETGTTCSLAMHEAWPVEFWAPGVAATLRSRAQGSEPCLADNTTGVFCLVCLCGEGGSR